HDGSLGNGSLNWGTGTSPRRREAGRSDPALPSVPEEPEDLDGQSPRKERRNEGDAGQRSHRGFGAGDSEQEIGGEESRHDGRPREQERPAGLARHEPGADETEERQRGLRRVGRGHDGQRGVPELRASPPQAGLEQVAGAGGGHGVPSTGPAKTL